MYAEYVSFLLNGRKITRCFYRIRRNLWSTCSQRVMIRLNVPVMFNLMLFAPAFHVQQKNSAMAGAVTGAALALTSDDSSHEQIVQCAITGAAISTAANLLTGIF